MIVYKLTDQQNRTRAGCDNECVWGEGVAHTATGKGGLCTDGLIHAYLSPELAAFLNPIHAKIANPKLWEAECEVVANERDLKVGAKSLTTLREVPLPQPTAEQRAVFAILCAREAFGGRSKAWDKWAADYVSGKDKSSAAARAAAESATYAAAPYAAAKAAYYAALAAEDFAASAATAAANAASYAALAAAKPLNLVQLAKEAMSS